MPRFGAGPAACAGILLDAHEAAMIEQERRELAEFAKQERESFFDGLRRGISAVAAFNQAPLLEDNIGQ